MVENGSRARHPPITYTDRMGASLPSLFAVLLSAWQVESLSILYIARGGGGAVAGVRFNDRKKSLFFFTYCCFRFALVKLCCAAGFWNYF